MTEAYAIRPAADVGRFLVGAHFIDAYRVRVAAGDLDAADAARSMLAQPPAWTRRLMALRNVLVAPFGLKTDAGPGDRRERIGLFPIESATPNRVVLGFDDRHLDFRVVVEVAGAGGVSEVTATTLVRLNNRLGRAYLAAILPFHNLIVRSMLSRVAR
ncbi:MAG TPA: DUF2867 domain-containing protein [Caulobacteraceae bacterium]|nr:DUF2867 domain-containing protein [Caulobacteraceae bacterium]